MWAHSSMVEPPAHNRTVPGSSPGAPTTTASRCANCGVALPSSPASAYCSDFCRRWASAHDLEPTKRPSKPLRSPPAWHEGPCTECGAEIVGRRAGAIYCTPRCMNRHLNRNYYRRKNGVQTKTEGRTCRMCEAPLSPTLGLHIKYCPGHQCQVPGCTHTRTRGDYCNAHYQRTLKGIPLAPPLRPRSAPKRHRVGR